MRITSCKLNHLTNPIGYQLKQFNFSYLVEESIGQKQKHARLLISLNRDMTNPILDTGFQETFTQSGIQINLDTQPRTRYYWTITVESDKNEIVTSSVNWFETAKNDENWLGKWITCESKMERHPIFTKSFSTNKKINKARLYICGLGLYYVNINNQKVGNEFLTPYCNNYQSWLQYQTYDVTHLLEEDNQIDITLGNGWYRGRYGLDAPELEEHQKKSWKVIAELHVDYEDGSHFVLPTDTTWKVRRSNILHSSIYDGEIVNDSLPELEIERSKLLDELMPPLQARLSTPVTAHKVLDVKEIIQTPSGDTILDLGQNFAGSFQMQIDLPKGKTVVFQFGEHMQDGEFYRENLRSAKAEYHYTSDGLPKTIQANFTFYGYRYVRVIGYPDIKINDFKGLVLYSQLEDISQIETGNPAVNQLIHNTKWSLFSNSIDIPTDCPQRDERMGWTGDAQVFSPTAMYLTDSYAFYSKYLEDMRTEQELYGGRVPNVIPAPCHTDTACAWGDAVCILPWNIYQYYGDTSILTQTYPQMKSWIEYIRKIDQDKGLWGKEFHWGDWLALDNPSKGENQVFGGTDKEFIADVFYMYSTEITAKTATILGNLDDAIHYNHLARLIRKRIQNEYFSPNGRCTIPTQTAYLLTLKHQLSNNPQKCQTILRQLFTQQQDTLQTGFIGTPILCPTLSENNMTDLAYKLLLHEGFPGWLYAVNLGATTIWERWDSIGEDGRIKNQSMSSLNHYSYGSIVEWIYKYCLGIRQNPETPGFRSVIIQPYPHEKLGFVKGRFTSASGTWKSEWEIINKFELRVKVTIPFNCTGQLILPFVDSEKLDLSNPILSNYRDSICYLEAGDYEITYTTNRALFASLSSFSTIGELSHDENIVEFINERIPGFKGLPEALYGQELQPFASMHIGISKEVFEEIDKFLIENY